MKERKDISNMDITVTLTGAQWFALLAYIARQPLSKKGDGQRKQAILAISAKLLSVAE